MKKYLTEDVNAVKGRVLETFSINLKFFSQLEFSCHSSLVFRFALTQCDCILLTLVFLHVVKKATITSGRLVVEVSASLHSV